MPDTNRPRKIGLSAISAFAWLAVAAIPIALLAPGCQGRECESDGFHDYGLNPGEGHLVDANTWETTPNNATWLAFGPYHTWVFHPVGLEGRDFLVTNVYFSADPNPNAAGSNFAIAAGNGATITATSDDRALFVTNSTCAPTYVRVVIEADPFPPSSTTDSGTGAVANFPEAGAPVDAGDLDAGDDFDAADASD
jgi:hypothetical protein